MSRMATCCRSRISATTAARSWARSCRSSVETIVARSSLARTTAPDPLAGLGEAAQLESVRSSRASLLLLADPAFGPRLQPLDVFAVHVPQQHGQHREQSGELIIAEPPQKDRRG